MVEEGRAPAIQVREGQGLGISTVPFRGAARLPGQQQSASADVMCSCANPDQTCARDTHRAMKPTLFVTHQAWR
jgi:hypothetical protein